MVSVQLALEPAGDRPYHKGSCIQPSQEDWPGCCHSHLERLPCFCYLPRVTVELYQKTCMCHLSSYQSAGPRIYHKDETKEAQRDQSGSIGRSCKCQIDDLIWHRARTESFQTSQKAHKVLGNICVLNTYTDPWAGCKPCTPIISTTTYLCNLIVGISVGTP